MKEYCVRLRKGNFEKELRGNKSTRFPVKI